MRFRLGLIFGFAVGYVLGTKAGNERYEQIRSLWQSIAGSEPAQQLSAEVRDVASKAGETLESKADEQLSKLGDAASGGGNGSNVSSAPSGHA